MSDNLWKPVFDWIKEDADLNAWLDDNEEEVLKTNDPGVLNIWLAATAYQGFDIKRILRKMRELYLADENETQVQTVEVDLRVGTAIEKFRYTSKESMARDIFFLCFLFSTRGSTWEKFQNKSISQIKEITDWLQLKYQIDTTPHSAHDALGPDVITIPRIAACFPLKMCELMELNYAKKLVTFEQIGLQTVTGLKASVLSPYFCCSYPIGWCRDDNTPHIFSFLVHCYVDLVIHKKTRDYTSLESILQYYSAAFRTPGVPDASRRRFARSAGFANTHGDAFNPAVVGKIPDAEDILRELYPEDRNVGLIISELRTLR